MNGMVPLPGDPAGLRAIAAALVSEAGRIAALRRVLASIDAGACWDSPAGRAFQAKVAEAPPVLGRVCTRYGAGGRALSAFADALEHAQSEVTAAIGSHEENARMRDRFAELWIAAEQHPDPAQQASGPGWRARMVAAGEEVFGAERRYRAAREAFDAADRACAGTLKALALDGLADTRCYDALTGVGDVAARVGWELEPLTSLPVPQLRAVASVQGVAVGVETASAVAVRAVYGDGHVDGVVVAGSVLVAGLGRTSTWLKSSAKANGAVGYGSKLRAGAAAELRHAFTKPPTPRPPRPPSLKGLTPRARVAALRTHAQARLQHEARVRFLDDWRVATTNGIASERLLIASLTAGGAAKDAQRALDVRARLHEKEEQQGG